MEVGAVHNERGAEAVQMSGVFGMVDIVLEEHLKWVRNGISPLGGATKIRNWIH